MPEEAFTIKVTSEDPKKKKKEEEESKDTAKGPAKTGKDGEPESEELVRRLRILFYSLPS
jgi:hypothetical protein